MIHVFFNLGGIVDAGREVIADSAAQFAPLEHS
jgi:hypothetical protein